MPRKKIRSLLQWTVYIWIEQIMWLIQTQTAFHRPVNISFLPTEVKNDVKVKICILHFNILKINKTAIQQKPDELSLLQRFFLLFSATVKD